MMRLGESALDDDSLWRDKDARRWPGSGRPLFCREITAGSRPHYFSLIKGYYDTRPLFYLFISLSFRLRLRKRSAEFEWRAAIITGQARPAALANIRRFQL